MRRKRTGIRTNTPGDGSSIWWSATDPRIGALIALLCLVLSSCFSPRTNPLDPRNPNAANSFGIALRYEWRGQAGGSSEDTTTLDTFVLEVSSEREIALTIWRFDAAGDGRNDPTDTLLTTSRTFLAPRSRDREIGVSVTAVGEDGARGRDSGTILPQWRVFNGEIGLVGDEVTALAVDSSGDLWVGCKAGNLMQYDGAQWVAHRPPVLYDLGDVSRVLVDADNNKWIGINVAGAEQVFGGLWLLDTGNEWGNTGLRIPADSVRYILGLARDSRGYLWILTRDHGVYACAMDVGNAPAAKVVLDTLFFSKEYLASESYRQQPLVVASVATTPDGGVWLGSKNHGLLWCNGSGEWLNYTSSIVDTPRNRFSSPLPANQITALAASPDGSVWVGTPGGLVHYLPHEQRWEITRPGEGFFAERDKVRAIAVASSGETWVGMRHGLVCIGPDGSWKKHTIDNSGLPDNMVSDIAIASGGSVWVATEGGVVRYHRYGRETAVAK